MIDAAKEFMQARFERFPHFSFGRGEIMIGHSLKVHQLARQLAEGGSNNLLVIELCALLHDVGKTTEAAPEILEQDHEALGWTVAKDFLMGCSLSTPDLEAIKGFFSGRPSTERDIVKDADVLAFFFDPVLQDAFVKWAVSGGKNLLIPRKWEKYHKLKLAKAATLGADAYHTSLAKWSATEYWPAVSVG